MKTSHAYVDKIYENPNAMGRLELFLCSRPWKQRWRAEREGLGTAFAEGLKCQVTADRGGGLYVCGYGDGQPFFWRAISPALNAGETVEFEISIS